MSSEISNETFRSNILAEIKSIQEELNKLKTVKRKAVKRKPARRTAKRKTVKRKAAKRKPARRRI